MLLVVSIFLPSRFLRLIHFVLGYSLRILPLLSGQISSFLKSCGDPGYNGVVNKLKISEICDEKK